MYFDLVCFLAPVYIYWPLRRALGNDDKIQTNSSEAPARLSSADFYFLHVSLIPRSSPFCFLFFNFKIPTQGKFSLVLFMSFFYIGYYFQNIF